MEIVFFVSIGFLWLAIFVIALKIDSLNKLYKSQKSSMSRVVDILDIYRVRIHDMRVDINEIQEKLQDDIEDID